MLHSCGHPIGPAETEESIMILADKIITLRKKNGWSQEELAQKLNVTRQSVSKWEGAQAVPDLERILQLSRIFGVSTDYLIKDELEEEEYTAAAAEEAVAVRRVSMEEAVRFLSVKAETAKRVAFAVFLCILSPVCLILLSAASEAGRIPLEINAAAGIGLTVLVGFIAAAVAIFLSCGAKTAPFEYLEQELIETEYGVSGMVKERQKQFYDTYNMHNILGACLCILSAVPLFMAMCISKDEFIPVVMLSFTLLLVGIGVVFFITAGTVWSAMQKLLQEGNYTKQKKTDHSIGSVIKQVYWLIVTAAFLGYSFTTGRWDRSWIIWPVTAVLYAGLTVVCDFLNQRKEKGL